MSHNFLHLTVQEYFCALHISFMSAERQLELFQKHKTGRFSVVLRFLAGLTKLSKITLKQLKGLLGQVHKQEGDDQQRDCCKRMVPDISASVNHINWLFEAQNTDLLQSLLHNYTVGFDFTSEMQPLEYYSVGYCIVHSHCNWLIGIITDIEIVKLHCKNSGVQCTPNHLHTYGVLTHLSLMVCTTHQIFGVLTHLSLKVCNTHQIFGLLTHPVTEGVHYTPNIWCAKHTLSLKCALHTKHLVC